MKYVVELNDDDGKSFQIEMHLSFFTTSIHPDNSSWKALDKGFIKYHSGGCKADKQFGFKPSDIKLIANGHYGIEFFELFDGMTLINSSGKGMAQQPWAVSFKPGEFSWALIS